MISAERKRDRGIGFLMALVIHVAAAVIVLWPRGLAPQTALAHPHDSVVVDALALPAPIPARQMVDDSGTDDLGPGPRGQSSSLSLPGFKYFSRVAQGIARFGVTPQAADRHDEASEIVGQAGTTSDRPVPRLDRDGERRQALVVQESELRQDGWSVVQPIVELADRFHSQAERWTNHLWQSTLFALAIGLLTIMLRRNRAHVRYWLWFSASVKFLLPFELLTNLGSHFQLTPITRQLSEQVRSVSLEQISQSLPTAWPARLWPATSTSDGPGWLAFAILGVWACGFAAVALVRLQMWRRVQAAVRASTPVDLRDPLLPTRVAVRATSGLLEPGVVGFWRPVLLLPVDIDKHLTPAQLQAVLAHELCHIQRGDNLTAAIHMVVEAVFWFHPLVWWLGARLVDERERACDEHVLRGFADPRAYADGILSLCKRYVDAQLACVSGVSGADLKKRIEAIMSNQERDALGAWKILLLATAGIGTFVVPIVVGTLGAPVLRAQSPTNAAGGPAFETSSVKASQSDANSRLDPQPGGRLTVTNLTAAELIQFAYDRPGFQVFGGSNWLNSDRFDVVAKAEGDPPLSQKRLMLRRLLAERFKLTAHTETRVLPIYALVLARSDRRIGPRLRRTEADCARADQPSLDLGVGPSPSNGPPRCGYFGFAPGTDFPAGRGALAFRGLTMEALAKLLVPMVRRSVSDQTRLTGYFDADFDFVAEGPPPPPPPPGVPHSDHEPFVSIVTVFPEQLGLKLDARRGPVEVLVIDRAEHPTPN